MIKLYNGDCLEIVPSGTMRGIDERHDWDIALPVKEMFEDV